MTCDIHYEDAGNADWNKEFSPHNVPHSRLQYNKKIQDGIIKCYAIH